MVVYSNTISFLGYIIMHVYLWQLLSWLHNYARVLWLSFSRDQRNLSFFFSNFGCSLFEKDSFLNYIIIFQSTKMLAQIANLHLCTTLQARKIKKINKYRTYSAFHSAPSSGCKCNINICKTYATFLCNKIIAHQISSTLKTEIKTRFSFYRKLRGSEILY